jgi:PAS domain S-box-containing protein
MRLVTTRGRLLEVVRLERTIVLRALEEPLTFHAELESSTPPPAWAAFERHALLEFTGVVSVDNPGGGKASAVRILLRSPGDVRSIKAAPVFRLEATMRAVGILAGGLLMVLIWVAALNARVRRQTRILEDRFGREAALERRYGDLLENAQELVFGVSLEGRLQSLNKTTEQAIGRSRSEALECDFVNLVAPEERERFRKFIAAAAASGAETLQEFDITNSKGERVPIEVNAYRLNDGDKDPVVQMIARDITERKKAQAEIKRLTETLEQRVEERTGQLAAANKELEAFSYSVSHDLRAPLRAIDGFSKILADEKIGADDEDTRHLIESIRKNAQRMAKLIDDLLSFSRLSRSPLELREVDMTALFREVWEEIRLQISDRKIEFTLHPLPPVLGDEALLRQVAVNLLSNAI